jgi:hypothetical protein
MLQAGSILLQLVRLAIESLAHYASPMHFFKQAQEGAEGLHKASCSILAIAASASSISLMASRWSFTVDREFEIQTKSPQR